MKKTRLNFLLILLFVLNINAQEKKKKETVKGKGAEKQEEKELDWDQYFIRYHPVEIKDGKEVFKSSEKTWYFLSPLEHLEADKGKVKVYGYIPKMNYGISEKLYKEIYKDYKAPKKDNEIKTTKIRQNSMDGSVYKKEDYLQVVKVKIPKGKTFKYSKWGSILKPQYPRYWKNAFSLMTVPVKVRPSAENIPRRTTSGLTNVGVNWELGFRQTTRFYVSGKSLKSRTSIGLMLAPSVEKVLASERTDIQVNEETGMPLEEVEDINQLFITTGLTLGLAINNINFVFVPVGFDFGIDSIGKAWAFNGKRWWGFGIGIETKALGAIFSK